MRKIKLQSSLNEFYSKKFKIKSEDFLLHMPFDVWFSLGGTNIAFLDSFQWCYFVELWQEIEKAVFIQTRFKIALNEDHTQFKKVK